MQRLTSSNQSTRFKGGTRQFHHSKARRSAWDQWVDGAGPPTRPLVKWLKILGVVAAFAALGGLIAGVILALGHG